MRSRKDKKIRSEKLRKMMRDKEEDKGEEWKREEKTTETCLSLNLCFMEEQCLVNR